MRRIFNNLIITLLAFSIGVFIVWKQNASDRQNAWFLTKQFHEAFIKRDEDLLARLLADDFKYKGYRIAEDKASMLAGAKESKKKPIVVEWEKITPIWIQADNQKAFVTCLIQVKYPYEDEKAIIHRGIYTSTYERQEGSWKLVFLNQDDNFSTAVDFRKHAKEMEVENKVQRFLEITFQSFWGR